MPQNELQHWGILGQKWGRRNGPPYPLGKADMSKRAWNKLSAEEKAARAEGEKQHLMKYGTVDDVAIKLRGQLTNEEYMQVLTRLSNEKKISDIQREMGDANWQKAEKTIQHAQTVHRGFNAAADLYNDLARVAIAGGADLPLVPTIERVNKVRDDESSDRRSIAKEGRDEQRKIASEERDYRRKIEGERRKEQETIRKEERERSRWLEDLKAGRVSANGQGSNSGANNGAKGGKQKGGNNQSPSSIEDYDDDTFEEEMRRRGYA